MNCCGKHEFRIVKTPDKRGPNVVFAPRAERTILPYEQCVFCAEKHLSDAWDLCRECGYEFPNRQTVIGALGSAERHLMVNWRDLAERVRAVRHLVQMRDESKIDWKPLLAEIDALATAEARKIHFDDKRK